MDEEQDQLASDFAINYLAKRGMKKEDILDEEGQLSPEIRDHIIGLMDKDGDRSTFLADYKSDPESKINSVIEAEDQMQSAKKGAKLKNLSKLQEYKNGSSMKKVKCACGCEMVSKKEKGGKMVSKCGCGCKGIVKGQSGIKVTDPNSYFDPKLRTRREVPGMGLYEYPLSNISRPNSGTSFNPTLRRTTNPVSLDVARTSVNPKVPTYIFPGAAYPEGGMGSYKQNYMSWVTPQKPIVTQVPDKTTAPTWVDQENIAPKGAITSYTLPVAKTTSKEGVKTGGNTSTSIIDYLNSIGQKSDRASRDKLAASFGIEDSGTIKGNTDLLNKLRSMVKPQAIEGVPRGQAPVVTQTSQIQPGLMTSGSTRQNIVNLPANTKRFQFNTGNEGYFLKDGGEVKKTKEGYLEVLKNGKDAKNLDLKKKKIKK